MDFLERLPSWLRWILAYPVAIIAALVISWLWLVGQTIFNAQDGLWNEIGREFILGVVVVWLSARIAPKHHVVVAIVTLCLGLVFIGMSAGIVFMAKSQGLTVNNESTYWIVTASMLVGLIIGCVTVYKEELDKKNSTVDFL